MKKKASSSTPTKLLKSSKEGLEINLKETDYLFISPAVEDPKQTGAAGINFIFTQFEYEKHTFQFIKEGASPARVFTDKKTALDIALKHNLEGYDVFFMVNEGDGIVKPGKRIARSQENVIELSKCFIDTDKCPIERVRNYLFDLTLTPHFEIESSLDRFHLYFKFEPVEPTEQNILKWKAIQNMLHRLGDPTIHSPSKTLGTDSTMHDYSKVLRVPGFTHIKKLFTTKIVHERDIPLYTLDELFTLTNAQSFLDYQRETTATPGPSYLPDLTATDIIPAGERFQTLQALSMHMANNPCTDDYDNYCRFVQTRLDNKDGIYCKDGHPTKKALDLFNSAFNKVKREQVIQVTEMHESLERPEKSPWSLDDSFYLTAPNGMGDIVKQVMDNSLYPCAALAFGSFITGLSILKSRTHFTPTGSSPALYTLNVAIAGYGKGDPLTLMQNTFVANGLGRLISNEVRSDRGLYNHLASNNGTAILILDEVAPLFRAIQQEDATSHHANISKAFLQLYSAGAMKGISLGKVTSSNTKKGEPEIVIDNPMLAIMGFTVPKEFNTLFSTDSVAKGLFQRFIPIVPEITYVEPNENADKHAIIKSDLFTASIPSGAGELDEEGNQIEPLQNTLRVRMPYTPEAAKRFAQIQRDYRLQLIDSAKNTELEHMSGLYSRLAEQVERLATVLSPEEIDLTTLEYAYAFMESRHRAILAVAEGTILRGVGSTTMEKEAFVLDGIARLCSEQQTSVVVIREVYQRVRRRFKDMKEFETCVSDLAILEKVEIVKNFRKKEGKFTRPAKGIRLLNVLD